MSKSNVLETDWLNLYLKNIDIANVGDAAGLQNSAADGSLYFSLHTADPGEAGNQGTSEATYTSYARAAVARGSGFTVSGNNGTNAATVQFPTCTGGSNTLTHWGLGRSSSGAGTLDYFGPIIASGATWLPVTAKADDTITIPGHSFVVDDRIAFAAAYSGTLPAGISAGTVYWVKTVTGNDITISTTQGGGTLDITAAGSGACIECSPITVTTNIRPEFAAGDFDIFED